MIPDYQQRVIDEKTALDDKIGKLAVFIDSAAFVSLDPKAKDLLLLQYSTMTSYTQILGMRVSLFGGG